MVRGVFCARCGLEYIDRCVRYICAAHQSFDDINIVRARIARTPARIRISYAAGTEPSAGIALRAGVRESTYRGQDISVRQKNRGYQAGSK